MSLVITWDYVPGELDTLECSVTGDPNSWEAITGPYLVVGSEYRVDVTSLKTDVQFFRVRRDWKF